MRAKALLALGATLLAVIGVAALAAFFVSRDDATVPRPDAVAPGAPRAPGSEPDVRPGNVVLLYGDERLTRRLEALAERSAGAPSPALAAAGQAVLVRLRTGLRSPVVAVSATHELEASSPDDPALRGFIEHWLGHDS